MSPFELAQSLGYGKAEMLDFLKRANPQISSALTQAASFGYTSDQAFNFLSKSMAGNKVPSKVQKRVFSDPNAFSMMRRAQNVEQEGTSPIPAVAGALLGAGVGFATGGPVGAAVGGMAGYNELNNLSKAYEDVVSQGGRIPFQEFVMKLAKGATIAGLAGKQIEPLREMAASYLSKTEEPSQEGQQPGAPPQPPPTPPGQEIIPVEGEVIGQEQVQQPTEVPITPQEDTRSYVERAMEGVDVGSLTQPKQARIRMINQQLDRLEGKGVPYESKRIQKILEKKDKIVSGEGLSAIEREKDRFETQYGKEGVKEEVTEEIKTTVEPFVEAKGQALTEVFKKSVQEEGKREGLTQKIEPIKNALKSSNVRSATFDADTGKMRAVFAPKKGRKSGTVYSYDNIDKETFEKMTGGKSRPLTEGSNEFGIWFPEKDPSVGASFSEYIRKNPEEFPYEKLDPKTYNVSEKQILASDRAHLASDFFEPFKVMRTKGRQKVTGKALKEMESALKDMDDEYVADIVAYIEDKIKLKHPPKMTRLRKEFQKEFLDANSGSVKKAARRIPKRNE